MNTHLLTNARIVTPTENFTGSLSIENGLITEIIKDRYYNEGVDLQGQWLTPGVIDIHTDYLEKELAPRPGASFPLPFALHFLDSRAAATGITTVFSALSFSDNQQKGRSLKEALEIARQIDEQRESLLVKHFLHARIDPNTDGILAHLDDLLALDSLYLLIYNENIPGERQFTMDFSIDRLAKSEGISLETARDFLLQKIENAKKINHRGLLQKAFKNKCIIGSHDDTTAAHVEEGKTFGAKLSEMPTTLDAARKARELGLWICMGAPNYYRGGSHCGNLSCVEALQEDLVDILCSDYYFPTLLASVVRMIEEGIDPSRAVNLVSLNPAKLLAFDKETGSIEAGKKADLAVFESRGGKEGSFASVSRVFVEGVDKLTCDYGRNSGESERKAGSERNVGSERNSGSERNENRKNSNKIDAGGIASAY